MNASKNSLIDRGGILQEIASMDKVVIEIGCGPSMRIENAISIDVQDIPGVDVIADMNEGLWFLGDETVDEIHSFHFLEHVSDLGFFMKEMHRVLKKKGKIAGTVPHFSNPYYYSDYTHRNPFGLYTFSYFSKSDYFRRGVPNFYNKTNFKVKNVEFVFASPFKHRNRVKKIWQLIFNSTNYLKEFYEENCCYLIPAFEIKFELEKN